MNKYGLEQEYRQISQGGSWIMNSTVHWLSKEAQGKKEKPASNNTYVVLPKFQKIEIKFLTNVDKKKEVLSFLSKKITEKRIPDDKNVYNTAGDQVHHNGSSPPLDQWSYQEADTRILELLFHDLPFSSFWMVFTEDTDIVAVLLSNFYHTKAVNLAADI